MSELDQQAGVQAPAGHGWFDVHADRRGHNVRAVCECGWTSLPSHAGGLAGALWDMHINDLLDPPDALALLAELEASLDRSEARLTGLPVTIDITTDGSAITVSVDGEQDFASDASLRALLFDLVARHPGCTVHVDMSAVTFMDSTALGTLVVANRRARMAGGDLHVSKPSARVRSVLDMTGMSPTLLRDR